MPDRLYADEWLPTRFSLGMLQLVAYFISSSLEKSRPVSGAFLNRAPHQHPLEATSLSLFYWLIPALQFALLAGTRSHRPWLVTPIAFTLLLVIVPVAWVLVALLFTPAAKVASRLTGRTTHDIQSLVTPTVMLLIAGSSVRLDWPGAPLGWFWIGLTVIEMAALFVCFFLRSRFAALERRLPAEAP